MSSPEKKRLVDQRWAETSASLRGEAVFVKMPVERARQLVAILERIIREDRYAPQKDYLLGYHDFLLEETLAAISVDQRSLAYSLPVKETALLVDHLKQVECGDYFGALENLRKVLQAGLRDDRSVDWISRMAGGPPPNEVARKGIEAELQRQAATPVRTDDDIALSELFDNPTEPRTGSD